MNNHFIFILLTGFFFSFNLYPQSSDYQPVFSTYWQQRADYFMEIAMDMKTYQYAGNQKIIYTNNSPDVLNNVYYHLYFNAFQPGSEMDMRLQSIIDPDHRMVENSGTEKNPKNESRIAKLKPNEIGFIKINKLTQNGTPLDYKVEGTVLEVNLAQPIASGQQAIFEMDFAAQIPVQIRRSGRNNKEGIELSMAQWYPKMAEYDREGWHTDPYIMREFYGVWGDFDVKITIDKDYTLGGTGYLQNPQEIVHGYENKNLTLNLPKTDKLTWHFKAPNVHDFTWAADKDYLHDILQTQDGITLHFLYQKGEQNEKIWKEMQPQAVKTMEFYNQLLGKYPYEQYAIIQGGDGGMEYGMCTLVNGGKSFDGLIGTVIHEMAHSWFQFALATNEAEHPWMDEGFTSFVETLANQAVLNKFTTGFPFDDNYQGYFYMAKSGVEEPLTTHADHYATNMSYGINAYYKGSVFLAQLSYIIGRENLEKTLKEYYRRWGGKHPTPEDFIRIAEQVSGLHLGWYLNEFVETTHTVDYGLHWVDSKSITLKRVGTMPMPIELKVVYEDNTEENFYIPLNMMRGNKDIKATILLDWNWATPTYTLQTRKKVKQVEIDPSQYMADVDRSNNVFKN